MRRMNLLNALPLMLLLADPDAGPAWEQAAKDDGITVYARERAGTGLREMKAVGTFDAAPEEVWKVLRDYEAYTKTMPYVDVSKIVAREGGDKVMYVYQVLGLPFIDKRDYTLKLVDESEWKDGQGFLKSTWTVSTDKGPAQRKDMVRLAVNDGFWKLEPRDGGKKTYATYYVYTDPGGAVPKWMVNTANSGAVPDVFKAIRKAVANNKKG